MTEASDGTAAGRPTAVAGEAIDIPPRVERPLATQFREQDLAAAYIASGGRVFPTAEKLGIPESNVSVALRRPAVVRLLMTALATHEGVVEQALLALKAGLEATTVTYSAKGVPRIVPDYRARVMAAGKILDVAMKIDDLAHRVAGYEAQKREPPVGRLLTPTELAAMTPYDRMTAVMNRQRVIDVTVTERATVILEEGEPIAGRD